jgi:glycosyltransferase involved in cell wall biosynthesis
MITIDCIQYRVLSSEFKKVEQMYPTLNVLDKVGLYDRVSSLITELSQMSTFETVIFGKPTHGGYLPIQCNVQHRLLFNCDETHRHNILTNISSQKINDIHFISKLTESNCILFTERYEPIYELYVSTYYPIIISNKSSLPGYVSYPLSNTQLIILIPEYLNSRFILHFADCIINNTICYDNLIQLCVMVKNGGDDFVKMLQTNLPFIDRWTILDTGSTDDTVNNIKTVMVGKPGQLFQEPFINFGESRNRCLELAGSTCTYNVMLDDTYHLKEDLRTFLQYVRGDQNVDSFSMYITQNDLAYASTRVFKSKRNLKYKYAIHEVIQEENNYNIIIPKENAYIYDMPSDKLRIRTSERKQQDIYMLQNEIDKNPEDPRSYYYMAQTYNGMFLYEEAYNWFLKRILHPETGFVAEKHEACLESGRIAQYALNKPATEFMKWYEMAHQVDPERPESLYFMGLYYYESQNNIPLAFHYVSRGFKLGFPEHRQYCLKPSISYHHIPKLLAMMCLDMNEYALGESACALYLKHSTSTEDPNMYETMVSWNKIFTLLVHSLKYPIPNSVICPDKPICCFISPSGLGGNWTGSDILKKGLGGSESYVIEMASQIQRRGHFNVIVFCDSSSGEIFNDVLYIPLNQLFDFLTGYKINTCIVNRFSEFLPVVMNGHVENIYLMAHDTAFSGNIIRLDSKLKGVFCLTPWHKETIAKQYPALKEMIKIIGHGIHPFEVGQKIDGRFIYSSFANRGLYELLLMWSKIIEWKPSATLHIYCDIDSSYMLESYGELMGKIRDLMSLPGVVHHGFVKKAVLYEAWKTSEVWLYPTSFTETFCVSALEAAASKTFAITTNIAGLQETVGDRGIVIDITNLDDAVNVVINALENKSRMETLIQRNYEWSLQQNWECQANILETYC